MYVEALPFVTPRFLPLFEDCCPPRGEFLTTPGLLFSPLGWRLVPAGLDTGLDFFPSSTGLDFSPSATGLDFSPSSTGLDFSPSATGLDFTATGLDFTATGLACSRLVPTEGWFNFSEVSPFWTVSTFLLRAKVTGGLP